MKTCAIAVDVFSSMPHNAGLGAGSVYRALSDHYSVNTLSDTLQRIDDLTVFLTGKGVDIISVLNRGSEKAQL